MNSTKRALALVAGASAVLAAGTVGATSAKAQLTNMLQSGIQRPSAGIYIGTSTMQKGTIQYTNSAGNNDAFSVGTSTAINASASASSTADYAVKSTASFDMGENSAAGAGGLSVINQQIGRASSESASRSLDIDTATSLSTSAAATAETETSKRYVQVTDTMTSQEKAGRTNGYWYWRNNRWNQYKDKTESGTTTTAATQYEADRKSEYSKQYDKAFSSSLAVRSFSDGSDGTISGNFVKNAGASTTSNYESTQYRNKETGQIADSTKYTAVTLTASNYDNYTGYTASDAGKIVMVDNSTNQAAFEATSELVQISDFKQSIDSTNTVTVKGINSENNIVADKDATFTSEITKAVPDAVGDASGTASGSAGGTVSTTASASASSSSFINSFVQAY